MYQAANILLTISEKNILENSYTPSYPIKMEQILEKPEKPSEITHNPLDVFIQLFYTFYYIIKYEHNNDIKNFYINDLVSHLNLTNY